jgi:hypothetical protein
LRANARPLVRVRAAWLPPSVMASWRRTVSAPARALSQLAQRARRAAEGSWPAGSRTAVAKTRIRNAFRRG